MQISVFSGNWIDLLILVFIGFYIWEGWQRGFITEFIDFLAFASAFIIALKLYSVPARILIDNFNLPHGLSNILSFIVLGLTIEQLLSYIGELVEERIPSALFRHFLNKLAGVIPLTANALVIITFVITVLLGLPIRRDIKAALSDSALAKPIISRTQQIEGQMSELFGEAISDTINFITIEPQSHEAIPLHFRQEEFSIDETSEKDMLKRVNAERFEKGLPQLVINEKLRDLARTYAKDMFMRGYFSHYNPEGASPFDRMHAEGITYQAAGENLAFAPSVAIAHQGLLNSPGHRANILSNRFEKVGIGVIDGGVYGKMFVQEFTD